MHSFINRIISKQKTIFLTLLPLTINEERYRYRFGTPRCFRGTGTDCPGAGIYKGNKDTGTDCPGTG
jgi:hypothetical protein